MEHDATAAVERIGELAEGSSTDDARAWVMAMSCITGGPPHWDDAMAGDLSELEGVTWTSTWPPMSKGGDAMDTRR